MAHPHSLLSPTTPSRSPSPSPHRLPIGPTPSISPSPARARSGSNPLTLSNPALGTHSHVRTSSGITTRSRLGDRDGPTSPSSSTFTGMAGGTHAGGVLPHPAFFRPQRPSQFAPPRPASALSHASSAVRSSGPLSTGDRFSRAYTIDSDAEDDVSTNVASIVDDAASRSQKSRDPLLPLSAIHQHQRDFQPVSISTGPQGLPTIAASPPEPSPLSPGGASERTSMGGGMRRSLELMFRRFSGDSSVSRLGPAGASLKRTSVGHSPVSVVLEKREEEESGMSSSSPRTSGHDTRDSTGTGPNPFRTPSKVPAFLPAPPPRASSEDAPLDAVPCTDGSGRRLRVHAVHPSRNRFFLGGRILTGGDQPWAFVGSFALVLGISGAWFGTTCVWWWREASPAVAAVGAYMCLLTISTMLATALRDPGILPRNLDLDPPCAATDSTTSAARTPLPRDLKVRAGVVRVKYCSTCKMYRPPRSSHCKMCDNCVEGCDHHCQWVNNCVGHRNYTSFFAFLMSAVLTLALVIVTSAIHLYLLTRREHIGLRAALGRGAGSAAAFSISMLVIWPITALLVYHMRLLLLNVTTIEQIRTQAVKSLTSGPAPPNPFSHGSWRRNALNVLCRPEGASWLDAHALATEDKREINPGLRPVDHHRS